MSSLPLRPSAPVLLLGALLAGAALGGCTLEDRSDDPEAGVLPGVEAEVPGPPGVPGRPVGEAHAPPAVVEVGDAFWHGEITRGVELNARFLTPEARAATLDPQAPVGEWEGRLWRLSDLLVSVDYREGPTRARWQLVGPGPVLDLYLHTLSDHPPDRTAVLDLTELPLEVRRGGLDGEGDAGPQGRP
jgi:hypothetical protein